MLLATRRECNFRRLDSWYGGRSGTFDTRQASMVPQPAAVEDAVPLLSINLQQPVQPPDIVIRTRASQQPHVTSTTAANSYLPNRRDAFDGGRPGQPAGRGLSTSVRPRRLMTTGNLTLFTGWVSCKRVTFTAGLALIHGLPDSPF